MNEHDQKHLTLSNRTYIEQELLQRSTFSSIAKTLHKDPTTISKEVKRYYKTVPAKHSYRCYICKHYKDCDLMSRELQCPSYQKNSRYCSFYCKKCYRRNTTEICPYFLPFTCEKINKPPYVFGSIEKYTEAMKYNLEHFSEIEERIWTEEAVQTATYVGQQTDLLYKKLTADLSQDIASPQVQDIIHAIIQAFQNYNDTISDNTLINTLIDTYSNNYMRCAPTTSMEKELLTM